jgi:ketopantoate reductase
MYLPALPVIAVDLNGSVGDIQLTLSAFMIAFGAGQIFYGPAGDRFGRRPVILSGLVVYVLASIGCAFAAEAGQLVLLRFLQGLAACGGVVLARTMVRDLAERDQAARAMSLMMACTSIAPMLAPLIGPETSVIFAMNGIPWWYLYRCPENRLPRPDLSLLDPEGALARTVGLEQVIGCMINSANAVVEPGVIRNSPGTLNRFTLGEPDGTVSRRIEAISAAFERAGVATPISTDIRAEIWEKLLRNLSTSPICAITGEPIGVIGRHPELFDLSKALMTEGLATARAHDIDPGVNIERAFATRSNSTHKSSMLQDFEHGRPPEIDGLLTAVQAFARVARVPTPHIDAVTALVIEKARKAGLYPAASW